MWNNVLHPIDWRDEVSPGGSNNTAHTTSYLFANVPVRKMEGANRIKDTWNFALSEDEMNAARKLLMGMFGSGAKLDLSSMQEMLRGDDMNPSQAKMLASLVSRHFMDKVVAPKAPVFSQVFSLAQKPENYLSKVRLLQEPPAPLPDDALNAKLMLGGAGLIGAVAGADQLAHWEVGKKKRDDEQSKTASALLRVLRQGAKVPHGQPFAPTLGTGAKRVLKLGFNPEMGVTGNRVKRLMQGAGLLGLAQGALQAGDKVSDVAGQAAGVIPDGTKLQPTKNWLEQWRDHPWITGAKTLWNGIPKEISPAQRQLLGSVGELAVRAKIHDVKLPSSKDMLTHFYSPALPPAQSALHRLLGMFIDPPGAKVYNNVARDTLNVIQE